MYVVDSLGRRKRHVVGLAPVSGMCNSLNSCTISEGTSFQVRRYIPSGLLSDLSDLWTVISFMNTPLKCCISSAAERAKEFGFCCVLF